MSLYDKIIAVPLVVFGLLAVWTVIRICIEKPR